MESRAVERALKGVGRPVEIHTIGIGARRVPSVLPKDLGTIIMAGLAGALDPALRIGEVVVDDPGALVPQKLSLRRGRILTAERIVATSEEKAKLFAETGAAAVDMEQADVQKLAKRRGVGFIGVRAISDTADEAVNPKILSMVDEIGRPKPMAMAAALMSDPDLVKQVIRLGKNAKVACGRLGEAVRMIVENLAG